MVCSIFRRFLFLILALSLTAEERLPRVLVSTDAGGTDPDDIQSLAHLFVYLDKMELEGLISSPFGPGRKAHLLEAIAAYEKDFPQLRRHSPAYPSPAELRTLTKQGATALADGDGVGQATEGSQWIISCARRPDKRPLHVLVWGGLEDLAQALHEAPDILPKLRVYWIGGPNKKWSVNAYNAIEQNHPALWFIEANSTYRGWFVGGEGGPWDKREFVRQHVAGHGALGQLFVTAKEDLKMGDTPSVAWALSPHPEDPTAASWGGQFVPLWPGRKTIFAGETRREEVAEAFGVVEFVFPKPGDFNADHFARMIFNHSEPPSEVIVEDDTLRFRFSPRDAKVWSYHVESNHADLAQIQGAFTARLRPHQETLEPSPRHPHWWSDDNAPTTFEGVHAGAKTINRWRVEYLADFARRMDRCLPPEKKASEHGTQ
ncbi:DUF1593 domain-containing protein [Roseibacillus ishigakijimensis]|uniref:DUF1593 domain-containing protein n=1 Tax=Roseibacillus ishigakijimensis TaxID=454146 RepID=A0A934RT72_9BACT|nr:DUF1593 domain-containing protein [Roseibacillus ishigakijimensis]MBK1835497.1 DUF1593 domain-containing protein [Roseibacillus ishigakijimensis]